MSEIKLEKWTIDKMLSSFNRILAKMDIPVSDKLAIEGMLITLGYEAQKAADVEEVVRCKDCRDCMEFTPKYKEETGYYGTCHRLLIPMLDAMDANVKETDYCSRGERKEGEDG